MAGIFPGLGGEKYVPYEERTGAESTVYFTRDLSPEGLRKIYEKVKAPIGGKVGVKLHTGEQNGPNIIPRPWVKELLEKEEELKDAVIVETNTYYEGDRYTTEQHRKTLEVNGWTFCPVDIMDEDGTKTLPIEGGKWMKEMSVGDHMTDYDSLLILTHFKGHAMGGFGGVMKNASIGVASTAGKAYIHTAGKTDDAKIAWGPDYLAAGKTQDLFLESMAAAAQAVHEYFNGNIIYINIMNNMSVDCDCDGHPAKPELQDMGIMASLDPVAVDQACLDKVFNYQGKPGDDNKPLIQRINRQHGTYITDYAEKIGLGSKKYELINLDK